MTRVKKYNYVRAGRYDEEIADPREALEEFLAEKRISNGGFAEFTEEDERLLYALLHGLIHAKFEGDPGGDFPLALVFVNRHYEHFPPIFSTVVPYSHQIDSEDDFYDHLENMVLSSKFFSDEADRVLRSRKYLAEGFND